MLVLSRKKDESVIINNDIRIVVVEIRGDKVRLGVEAPKEVPVHRSEVYDAINHGMHGMGEGQLAETFVPPERRQACLEGGSAGLTGGGPVGVDETAESSQSGSVRD